MRAADWRPLVSAQRIAAYLVGPLDVEPQLRDAAAKPVDLHAQVVLHLEDEEQDHASGEAGDHQAEAIDHGANGSRLK